MKQVIKPEEIKKSKNIVEPDEKSQKLLTEIGENESYQVKDGLVLDEGQRHAYLIMENADTNYFITGREGMEKSFLLRFLKKEQRKNIKSCSYRYFYFEYRWYNNSFRN